MGAFIGIKDIGIWASNSERDALLDWFAEYRCSLGDARWQWCKSEGQRWPGRCLDLSEFLQAGEQFRVTDEEAASVSQVYGKSVSQLLRHIEEIHQGEWLHQVNSDESLRWRAT